MFGGSLRNQGRYFWNCSSEGLTGPSVRLMQFFKQARESAKMGGLWAAAPQPGTGGPPFPCRSPGTAATETHNTRVTGVLWQRRGSPLSHGSCLQV